MDGGGRLLRNHQVASGPRLSLMLEIPNFLQVRVLILIFSNIIIETYKPSTHQNATLLNTLTSIAQPSLIFCIIRKHRMLSRADIKTQPISI